MLKLIRGTDRGNALLTSLVLIMVLSSIFMSLVPRIGAVKRYAGVYKADLIRAIEKSNREIIIKYDLP